MSAESRTQVELAEVTLPADSLWAKLPLIGGIMAFAGLVLSITLGMGDNKAQMAFSLLVALAYFASIGLGAMFFVLFQFAAKAGWSVTLRRLAEGLMHSLPFVAAGLFLVFGMGMYELFHWADAAHVAHDPILSKKAAYLNTGFFWGRNVVYLLCWLGIAVFFVRTSAQQDHSKDRAITWKLQAWSYPAIVVFAITLTGASWDWLMSLDPHWFSTMWGVYYFAGAQVAGIAAITLMAVRLRAARAIPTDVITTEHLHDIGKFLFAFTVFWTYIAFSQYMLYWYANIPEETLYYQHRAVDGWKHWSHFLAVGHFVLPFFFLISRHVKRNPFTLGIAAGWILIMHYVDIYWVVMPTLHHHGPSFHVQDLAGLVFFGGLFLLGLGLSLRKHALVPVGDPRLQESLAFVNF